MRLPSLGPGHVGGSKNHCPWRGDSFKLLLALIRIVDKNHVWTRLGAKLSQGKIQKIVKKMKKENFLKNQKKKQRYESYQISRG